MVEILAADNAFHVEWSDPEQATRTWLLDEQHAPGVIAPFAADLWDRWMSASFSVASVVANMHAFSTYGSISSPRPPPDLRSRDPAELWSGHYRPQSEAAVAAILTVDGDALSIEELASRLPTLVERSVEGFVATHLVNGLLAGRADELFAFCRTHLGGDAGVQLAHETLQGRGTETTEMALALERLAEKAAASPELCDVLARDGALSPESAEQHRPFSEAFARFLERYGWRASTWTELHVATWAEDPAVPIAMIVRYARDESTRPSRAYRRAAEARDAAVDRARGGLANDADRAAFDALLTRTARFAEVRESRAHWQLQCSGALRRPLLALGRKLEAAGALDDAEDVLLFHLDELADVAVHPGADRRALARRRRAEFERCRTLDPPPYLGAAPTVSSPQRPGDVGEPEGVSVHDGVLAGTPASRGVAHGRARVIIDLSHANRLGPGDVLVCRATAPPWTGLFAIASAVVTSSGGMLSHSAIVAREYGIPCVVGVAGATETIPDGAMVTVDGTRGTVAIEG